MDIISKQEHMIFKNEDGKYCMGLSKKTKDGKYENGYIPCRFRKDVELDNQTKIKIKNAWLDFYKVEKKTFIYLFINEFEKVEEQQKQVDNFSAGKDIELTDDDLPFYG